MGIVNFEFNREVTLPTTVSPSLAVAVTVNPVESAVLTVTESNPLSMSGIIFKPEMLFSATGSNQTVCQMPVTQVYIAPLGAVVCFPLGCP